MARRGLFGLFAMLAELLRGARAHEGWGEPANALANGIALARILAPDQPDIVADIEAYAAEEPGDAWQTTLDLLSHAQRIGVIDWRSEPDELKEAVDPMLRRHGVTVDWSFIDELEKRGDWNALKNQNLLPRVAKEIAKQGLVLAHIDEASDAFMMAVCTPAEFKAMDGVTIDNGAIVIRRFR